MRQSDPDETEGRALFRRQTEKIQHVLDAVAERVLAYRPVDKGLAARKTARKLKRKAKADD